jgi:hypothetical protein
MKNFHWNFNLQSFTHTQKNVATILAVATTNKIKTDMYTQK